MNTMSYIWIQCHMFEYNVTSMNTYIVRWIQRHIYEYVHCQMNTTSHFWILRHTLEYFVTHLNTLSLIWMLCHTSECFVRLLNTLSHMNQYLVKILQTISFIHILILRNPLNCKSDVGSDLKPVLLKPKMEKKFFWTKWVAKRVDIFPTNCFKKVIFYEWVFERGPKNTTDQGKSLTWNNRIHIFLTKNIFLSSFQYIFLTI